MRTFWIDTDTASDDAVAIVMALRWPDVKVAGISVVNGNVSLAQASVNARYTVELCEADVPVYEGADRPLVREVVDATFFHGTDGMGNMNYPEPLTAPQPQHAVDALIDAVRAAPGEITLVTLGPLTNIALAIRKAPDIVEKIPMTYVMGGAAATLGNITPAAEYNIWVDPEAAHIVFHSGLPILMVGAEHSRDDANLNDDDIALVRSFDTPLAHFTIDINLFALEANRQWFKESGIGLPDPVTMAIALDPSVCTRRSRHYVDVEIHSDVTRGMTVVDARNVLKRQPNVEVCWEIDVARWKETLYQTIR
ncbi:MAG TPA: nucleoside hydrolase [Thermomicrobiales bacterium]|nr:nucleoside hydrolase [Thermomicrobiales bacterium]